MNSLILLLLNLIKKISVHGRVRRDGAPGDADPVLGPEREREDPDHEHARRARASRLIRRLLDRKVKLNVTAVFTDAQLASLCETDSSRGRCHRLDLRGTNRRHGRRPHADRTAGRAGLCVPRRHEDAWASPREALNIYQADQCGCHIITCTDDLLSKLPLQGKSLAEYSLDTVKMFHGDAAQAGFSI